MKSQLFLRRSRTFVKTSAHPRRALLSSLNFVRYTGRVSRPTIIVTKRHSSSTPLGSPTNLPDVSPSPSQNPSDPPPEESVEEDKPKRRARTSAQKDSEPLPQLPSSLNILWTPNNSRSEPSILPPAEIFEEILDNLHVTLHPQTQHRATYASAEGPPVEPTFALYCPIEGGDYIIDETVQELARRTGSDVVILDAVHLAAGESGLFGKAATVLQLPENPLHFPASSPTPPASSPKSFAEDEDEEPNVSQLMPSSQMTVHLLAPAPSRSSRYPQKSTSKSKAFFDELVNISPPLTESGESSATPRKPRLIYIRDFPTLAASSSTWYPALLAAVRQRRAGPIARITSPIPNPMTIVFGMTPPITPSMTSSNSSPSEPAQGLINLLMNRQASSTAPTGIKVGKSEWNEDEVSERARERRLKERLRKWEKGNVHLLEELPGLMTTNDQGEGSTGPTRKGQAEMVFFGNQPMNFPLPAFLNGIVGKRIGPSGDSEPGSGFYRHSVIVPSVRSIAQERACRIARRREINELTMRMAVASVGGFLPPWSHSEVAATSPEAGHDGVPTEDRSDDVKMWDDWSRHVTVWPIVRQIADRAVGSSVDQILREANGIPKITLDPTPISWSAIARAWVARKSIGDVKKTWLNDSFGKSSREHGDESEDGAADKEEVDEIIEGIKQDPELDQHEQRLLGCIVDPRSLTSTFEQVHLPPHTIDSVRTIVSLPLLHPEAFQHGILREHGITGCLLFGPPGTGKTLIVRALAKEAECRMLAISPSDVMDMYVGEGEKLVKAVFSLARRLSPCVVFIDEIDSLFGARMSSRETGGALAHRGVITEFMSEMDGLRSSREDSVIVIGATNRPFDLDDAVLRRMPRRLLVDLPGEKEREEILKILLREEVMGPDVDFGILAKKTENFSGSDLKHLCVSAALDAVKGHLSLPWTTKEGSLEPNSSSEKTDIPKPTTSSHGGNPSEFATLNIPTHELQQSSESSAALVVEETDVDPVPARILMLANFTKALKEITPSSSESLGTLGELRKWNDEFGEGRKENRRKMWGKGNFGFVEKDEKPGELKIGAEVAPNSSSTADSRLDR